MSQQTAADHLPDAGKMVPEDHSGDVNKKAEEIELLKEALKGSKVIADEAAHQIRAAQSVIDTYTRKIHDLQEDLHAARVAAGEAELARAKAVKDANDTAMMFAKESGERAALFWENKALKQRIEKMEANVRKALKQLL